MSNDKLFPWTRRQMMERMDNGEGLKRLAHEYGLTEAAVYQTRKRWKMYKKLEAFFGDLLSRRVT